MRAMLLLFVASIVTTCCSAQLKKQRVIARASYYDSSGENCCRMRGDSSVFKYSGSRGSRFNERLLNYSVAGYSSRESEILRLGTIIHPNNIDSNEYTPFALFDTMWVYGFDPGMLLVTKETCEYYPDGTPNIATSSSLYDFQNNVYLKYTAKYRYSFGDLISEAFSSDRSSGEHHDWGERFVARDASGNVVTDSFGIAIHYEYDGQDRYISASGGYWQNAGIFTYPYPQHYDYYPDGKVRTIREVSDFGIEYDTFTYMPGVSGYATRTHYSGQAGQPPLQLYKYSCHLNAAGLKDTIIEDWDNGRQQSYHAVEYNAFGNPVMVTSYNDPNITPRYFSKVYYYYELYDDAPAVSAPPYMVTVFPNPTSGLIKIDFSHSIPPNPIGVQITNVIGQVVYSQRIALSGSKTVISFGSEKAPGVYTIRISGSNNEDLYKGTILKY